MPDEKKFFYTNSVEIAMSPYDFVFTFVRNTTGPVSQADVGKEMAGVRSDEALVAMSPIHAKVMLASIYKTILFYEEKFGAIPMPPDKKAEFDQTFGKKN